MDVWLKTLVSAACLTVVGAVGWFAYAQRQDALELAAFQNWIVEAEKDERQDRCRESLANWDAGNFEEVRLVYGRAAESAIGFCRAVLDVVPPR